MVGYGTIAVSFYILHSSYEHSYLFLLCPKALAAVGVCNSLGEIGALSAHVLRDHLVKAGIIGHLQLRLLYIAGCCQMQ